MKNMDNDRLANPGANTTGVGNDAGTESISNPVVPTSAASSSPATATDSATAASPVATPVVETSPDMASALQTPIGPNRFVSNPFAHASHTTGRRPQRSDDIILDHSPEKPPMDKKPWIVGGIIVAVMVVVLLVVMLITSFAGAPKTNNSTSEQKFTQYATYLLYGEVRDELEGEYDPDETYKLDEEFDSEEYHAEYWDTAKALLDEAVSGYRAKEGNVEEEYLAENLNNYMRQFSFIYNYRKSAPPSIKDIQDEYLTSGAEATKEDITQYYGSILNSEELEDELLSSYVETSTQRYSDVIDILDIYQAAGCLSAEGIDQNCNISAGESLEALIALENNYIENSEATEEIIGIILGVSKEDCWKIIYQMNNPAANEETLEEKMAEENAVEDVDGATDGEDLYESEGEATTE